MSASNGTVSNDAARGAEAFDHLHPIAADKRVAIADTLRRIEREYAVHVLPACESGSRGWASPGPTATTARASSFTAATGT